MKFQETKIKGLWLVELNKLEDQRGFFSRAWCQDEFAGKGITAEITQANISMSVMPFTIRGMHYQVGEDAETKSVRCINGALFDVAVDLRPDSTTYKEWFGVELNDENNLMLVVPEGCAHGFLTLKPNTTAYYQVSNSYAPDAERGFRWDDPSFSIDWPSIPQEMSDKDRNWTNYEFKS